ncbi:histidine phosphatase family protein [Ruania zhangjianzhongii]|uniref:histidine phosphatase family protein n=1 Tax=Ruania zhangjianzhongii TaxID=2603206 RepID=UPI0011C9520A|nr:histidine phosphatase family protein [Ruania zhangjianzhongii]
MDGSVDIVLIRHAQSQWNAESRFQGHECAGLSALGHRQAGRLAAALTESFPKVHTVVASDLQRVRETAAPYLAATGRSARYDRRLREIDVGTWAGMSREQVREIHPEQMAALDRGEDLARGGGETFAELRARIWGALTDIAAESIAEQAEIAAPAPVLVFAHGGPLRVAAAAALGLPPMGRRWIVEPANCALSHIRMDLVDASCTSATLVDHDVRLIATTREGVLVDDVA